MGGYLTVSSREHCGSTFTFILPYKVSNLPDHSDDPDELSDMADHDAASDANNDDITAGFFQFQPRTLGSLFSTGGSNRTQKLSPHNNGFPGINKLNGLSEQSYAFPSNNFVSKEMDSPEDASSVVDAAETTSESECSRNSPDPDIDAFGRGKQFQEDTNGQFKTPMDSSNHSLAGKELGVMERTTELKNTYQRHEKSDIASQCVSSSSAEVSDSSLKPKILLVEDNKINVMVTQSMMKQIGHTIDVVNNGVEAVRAVQSHSYDLVLMVTY